MIQIREYQASDYPTVSEWWDVHGWPAVPEAVLPKLGIIAFDEVKDLCAGWLYMDNSVGVCWLEWLVTNPLNRASQSMKSIGIVTDFLKLRAVELGYGIMMTTCRQKSLVRVHEKNGFLKTDEGMIHLLCKLN
jgi:hypothetical protein